MKNSIQVQPKHISYQWIQVTNSYKQAKNFSTKNETILSSLRFFKPKKKYLFCETPKTLTRKESKEETYE